MEATYSEAVSALPTSIQAIIQKIQSKEHLSPARLKKIIKEAQVQPEELMPWADFDHDPADCYGRKMLYDGGFFDMMVMSWNPGDFSAIHDHGYSQWGAVQSFGPAEHAVFLVQDGYIQTLSRNVLKSGQIIGVGHQLVHQMGNSTENERFISLHIYGNLEVSGNVTGDARIFDLNEGSIQRVDGGAFLALPEKIIKKREAGPQPDYLTWLRNTVELIRRRQQSPSTDYRYKSAEALQAELFDINKWTELEASLEEHINEQGHHTHSVFWKLLNWELKEAAQLQEKILNDRSGEDRFHYYAEVYDEVIGKPCRDQFMANYIRFFQRQYQIEFREKTLLSIGCGTGLMERFMIEELDLKKENLLGIDISEAMVKVAAQHILAETGDALELDPAVQMWDLTFCGLNVFQYLDHQYLADAIRKAAEITKPGGYFFGDFITPDHIRWYPHVIYSACERIISLRSPQLIEKENHMYQRSRIINVNRLRDQMRITYEGEHERFLPPLSRVRAYFQAAFGGKVDIYDALSLEPIHAQEDTCGSTRYLVVAERA